MGWTHRPAAEVEAIEQRLAEAPADVPDIHPNVAELYRRKVERLSTAMDQPEERDEAAKALRGLIDHIVITPGAKRGEVYAVLHGDLERALAWAEEEGGQRLPAAGGFPVPLLPSRVTPRACAEGPPLTARQWVILTLAGRQAFVSSSARPFDRGKFPD